MKTNEQAFVDWESSAFGYGYGTGEQHILPEVRRFFQCVRADGTYDYREIESEIGVQVTWLLINALCKMDALEYGCSPRLGWLTEAGARLGSFVRAHDAGKLLELTETLEAECSDAFCNCDHAPTEAGCKNNPFFRGYQPTTKRQGREGE